MRRKKKNPRRRGWVRLKGRGHCLEQSCCRLPFIYCLQHTLSVLDGTWEAERRKQAYTQRAATTTMTSQTVQKGGTSRQTYGFCFARLSTRLQPISPHCPRRGDSYSLPASSHPPSQPEPEPHLTDRCLNDSSQHTSSAPRRLERTSKCIL